MCNATFNLPYTPGVWDPYTEGWLEACCIGDFFVDQAPDGITCFGIYSIQDLGWV